MTGPLEGSHAFQEVQSPLSYCPRSSLPVEVLHWLAERLAHLCPARRGGQGGTPPLRLEVRLDALGAVVLDGLSYRRAARTVGICKTEVVDSLDLLLGELGELGELAALWLCQPDGTFVATLQERERLAEMTEVGEAVCVDGLATRVQRPGGWANQKACMTPGGAPTPPRAWRCRRRERPSTAICLWCDGGWPGSCHEHELLEVSGVRAVLDATGVTALVDRGFRGTAKVRARWHAPIGDRRTNDQRTPVERDHNRLQAGLRAVVEQAIGHLANAWTLRRWRGLLYRVRDVYRAAAALICPGPLVALAAPRVRPASARAR